MHACSDVEHLPPGSLCAYCEWSSGLTKVKALMMDGSSVERMQAPAMQRAIAEVAQAVAAARLVASTITVRNSQKRAREQ